MPSPAKPARLAAALLFGLAGQALAADLVVTNARLLDGTGAAPVNGASLVVENDRIASIVEGPVDAAGALVVDAKGKTVTPGISDLHVHSILEFLIDAPLEGDFESGDPDLFYPDADSMFQNDADIAAFIEQRLPKRMRSFLEAGVTTIVDPGGFWPWILQVRDSERSGALLAPRMFVVGKLFTAPTGHPGATVCHSRPWCVENLVVNTDDVRTARQAVREFAAGGVDGIKIIADRGPPPRISKEVVYAIVNEAHRAGLPVVGHTLNLEDSEDLIDAGIDAFVHGLIMKNGSFTTSTGRYLPDYLVQQNVPMTTTYRFAGSMESRRNLLKPSVQALMDAGVTLLFGTDFEGIGLDPDPRDNLLVELKALQTAGLSNAEIIKILTANAAKHPMTPADIGTLQEGKLADILVLKGDPLKDITALTHPEVVIKGGRIVVDKR